MVRAQLNDLLPTGEPKRAPWHEEVCIGFIYYDIKELDLLSYFRSKQSSGKQPILYQIQYKPIAIAWETHRFSQRGSITRFGRVKGTT